MDKLTKSIIYSSSGFHTLELKTPDEKPIFRKQSNFSNFQNEFHIVNLLKENPQPNVVNIFDVSTIKIEENEMVYNIDMELLETDFPKTVFNRKILRDIKSQLQSLGILYIDWKPDNFGIDNDGILKIFDFDCSGILNPENILEWSIEPPKFYNYNLALKNGLSKPKDIDDFCFDDFIRTI